MAYWPGGESEFRASNHQSYRPAAAFPLKLHQLLSLSYAHIYTLVRMRVYTALRENPFRVSTATSRHGHTAYMHTQSHTYTHIYERRRNNIAPVVMIIARHRVASRQAAQKIGSLHYNDFLARRPSPSRAELSRAPRSVVEVVVVLLLLLLSLYRVPRFCSGVEILFRLNNFAADLL